MLALGLVTIAVTSAGCGQSISGNYTLNETLANSQLTSTTCQSSTATLNLVSSNNNVNGSATNTCFTETLVGTQSGNQITGITWTLIPSATSMTTTYGSTSAQTSCVYTGSLNVSQGELSGSLTLSSSTPTTTTSTTTSPYYNNTAYSYCASTIVVAGSQAAN